MRVLMVTPRYYPFIGGVQNHVHQVARRLVRSGIDVTILSTDPSGSLPTQELTDGITHLRARAYPAKRDYYFAPQIAAVINDGSWDLIHLQSYHTLVAPLAMLAALRARVPYVVTFHGGGHSSTLRNRSRALQQYLLRPLLARAQRLIAVARFEIELYSRRLRLPAERFALIPNGADIAVPEQPLAAAPSPGTLIVSVGRLERYKGHHRVIAALPSVLARRPDVHLRIAGAGDYETELHQLAERLGVANRVTIQAVPPDDRDGMRALYASSALVTLLSEYETHPIAVLEALALKRPVLTSDTSGLRELADRGLVRAIALASSDNQVATAILDQLDRPLIPADITLPTWDDCAAQLSQLYQATSRRLLCAS